MVLLDRLFHWIRSSAFFYRLMLFTRLLLAAGFIPTGLVKLAGKRFTQIEVSNPIGAFFEAMYQTGMYWQFLGFCQVVAGLWLLIPPLAHLGAALFLPIMVNIFVITVSVGFKGTPVVTGLMLLAVSFLCFWDYHRFRPLLREGESVRPGPVVRLDGWERLGFSVFGGCLLGFFLSTRFYIGYPFMRFTVVVGALAGVLTLGRFLWQQIRARSVPVVRT